MGYSLNPELVERRRHLLANLERGIQSKWVVAKDPVLTKQYAYEIREALYIASQYPERFSELAEAYRNFAIEIVGPGLIQTKVKRRRDDSDVVVHGLEPQGRPVSLIGPSLAVDVIQSWEEHLPSSDPLNFVQMELGEEELAGLYVWATNHQPGLMLLVDQQNKLLTVTHKDPAVAEFAWHPPKATERKEEFDI